MRLFASLLLVACADGPAVSDVPATDTSLLAANQPPRVQLEDQSVGLDAPTTLRPTVEDPDGDPLSYRWLLRVAPPLSRAMLDDPTAPEATFTPDRVGAYLVDLTVFDGQASATAAAVVTAGTGTKPIADLGGDRAVAVGRENLLDARASYDPDGAELFYSWALMEAPTGSTATLSSQASTVPFVADELGEYRVLLTVHNGSNAASTEITIEALPDDVVPGDVAKGGLLPGQVYVMGTTDDCTVAFGHWSDFDTLVGGIDQCEFQVRSVRVGFDGSVYYLGGDGLLRRFGCDDCPTWAPGDPLSKAWQSNDTIVDTAPCDGKNRSFPAYFAPGSDGRNVFWCDNRWRDDQDRELLVTRFSGTLWYGPDDKAMDDFGQLLDFAAGTVTPVTGWPKSDRAAAGRVVKGGFWAVVGDTLWFVDSATGTATTVYEYPSFGPDVFLSRQVLDADGTLLSIAFDKSGGRTIRRRRLDGVADIVQDLPSKSTSTWLTGLQLMFTGP